jgi:hypothetical protein
LTVYNPRREDLNVAQHAVVELLQLETIVDLLANGTEIAGTLPRLETALGGRSISHQDKSDAGARSVQFELYLAAILQLLGLRVSLEEPDIVARTHDSTFGVAAKRLRSTSNVKANIRKADKQLSIAGIPGLIALDLAFPAATHVHRLPATLPLAVVSRSLSRSFVNDHESRFSQWCRSVAARAVLIHVCTPVLIEFDQAIRGIGASTWWDIVLLPQASDADRLFFSKLLQQIGLLMPRKR